MAVKSTPILTKDSRLRFPEFVLLKASAGSGKTRALSLRFVQFLLSDTIRKETPCDPRNILAITFTRNAAREMKDRILDWLKASRFWDPQKQPPENIAEVLNLVTVEPAALPGKAESVLESILSRYTDFQVATIDSFMASIFQASALDLGYGPSFDIVMDDSEIIAYAFSRYLRNVSPRSRDGRIFKKIAEDILTFQREEASYPWDPSSLILEKLGALRAKLAARKGWLGREDFKDRRRELEKRLVHETARLKGMIESSGLEPNVHNPFQSKLEPAIRGLRFSALLGLSLKTPPVKKPSDPGLLKIHDAVSRAWEELKSSINEYKGFYARDFFSPYLSALESFSETLDSVKREFEAVFIEDINQRLSRYIDQGIVPDVYFRLGDRIAHFLIDEFQDTSEIQWENMKPLVENSLAQAGSLFIVGDTKQAIFGFRDADYRIMRDLEDASAAPFPSAGFEVRELKRNYRSRSRILEFSRDVFLVNLAQSETYGRPGSKSGLTDYRQEAVERHRAGGYVELVLVDKNEDALPEKGRIQAWVKELRERGYRHSDIAVLTYKNESVVTVSSWLNEAGVPFIPFSSLDIRTRKTTAEILAFLKFLDAPLDDLSLAVFLLGDILAKKMNKDGQRRIDWPRFLFHCRLRGERPLYAALRAQKLQVWEQYFEFFFKTVGYYPLYDLATQVFRTFDIFELFPEEEAALTKLLESIKDFEGLGKNDLREFLEFTSGGEEGESRWNIDVPANINAVRVMSIHKAKGLGFPVVILLLYGEKFHPLDFYLHKAGESIRVYKLTRELAEADRILSGIYEQERERELIDRLNTLYVGVTRAQSELYVIGVKGTRDQYPFDLVENLAEKYRPSDSKPEPLFEARSAEPPEARTLRFASFSEPETNPRESLNAEAIRRGNLLHAILAGIEFLSSDWTAEIDRAVDRLSLDESDKAVAAEIGRTLVRYFGSSPVSQYFERRRGRRVLREAEFCDAAGRLFRMDRVVFDEGAATLLDFKSGFERSAEKRAERDREDRLQMSAYLDIIRQFRPELPARGILVHIDQNSWETLE
jgi:ATP-dependent helicase/nuclease subunit A